MNDWNIGLSSWVIQDGNYPNFSRGEIIRFPVEVTLIDISIIPNETARSARLLGNSRYQVVAEVIYLSDDKKFWVLDFGVLAFVGSPSTLEVEIGAMVSGDIFLRVDEASYCSYVNKLPDIPPLIYTWRVERIKLDTTPWIAPNNSLQKKFVRDISKVSYREVAQTNAWIDDPSGGEYYLDCLLLDDELEGN